MAAQLTDRVESDLLRPYNGTNAECVNARLRQWFRSQELFILEEV
ncbi:hypothetical protein [Martelella sp. AD-3]|nr:hypothetical protein [Martelella sp. AD-3]